MQRIQHLIEAGIPFSFDGTQIHAAPTKKKTIMENDDYRLVETNGKFILYRTNWDMEQVKKVKTFNTRKEAEDYWRTL